MSLREGSAFESSRGSNRIDALPAIMGHHLIVTTAGGVYSWSNRGSAQLLSSTSKGIVTARNMHTDKHLLAVADSQIVLLHNMEKGMQRTYRLRKENQGHIRKLFYHPDKQRLFFTTTLQNAVQSFSLQHIELLDAAPTHPSPPTVFAVSPACDLLVSASTDPPTIYLSRIACKQPPLLFIPNCSSAFVVSISFHPTRANIFVLGFEDGTIAAYNASALPVSQFTEERFSYAKIYGEISHIAELHNYAGDKSFSGQIPESKQSNASSVPTISGIQFLPKRLCSVVSVGADGNCFVVDFQEHSKRGAEILRAWNLQVAATSLAVIEVSSNLAQTDGQDDSAGIDSILLAVGKTDGTVSVYDNSGQLLATKDFSKDGRILDLEWAQQSKNQFLPISVQPASNTDTASSRSPSQQHFEDNDNDMKTSTGSRSPPASKIMVKLHVKTPPPDDYLLHGMGSIASIEGMNDQGTSSLDGNAISIPENQQHVESRQSNVPNYVQDADLDSPSLEEYTTAPETKSNASHRSRSRRSSCTTNSSAATSASSRRRGIPVVPSRPVPRPGGKLALRRVDSAKGRRQSTAAGSPPHRKRIRISGMKQFRFKDLDHDLPTPPKLHQRYASSNISPLSEVPKPVSPINLARPQSVVVSPLAAEPLKTPLQYNRLVGPSLDAAPSTSMSKTSVFHESDLDHRPAVPIKVSELRKDSLPPPGISDSSTSAGSVLDWTPSSHLRTTTTQNRPPSLPQAEPKQVIPHTKPLIRREDHYQESDSSPASQLDWHDDRGLIGVEGFDMLSPLPSSKSPSASEKARQVGRQRRSTPISPLAPLQNFKLRKRQTTINLKKTNESAKQAKPEETTTANIPTDVARQSVVSLPLRSDSNLMKQLPPNSVGILLHETASPSSESAPVQPPPSVPASSNTRTTQQPSSPLKSTLNSRQVRSSISTARWHSTYTIEDVIRIECAAICTRIDAGFDEHKAWLQGLLREQNWYTLRLEEENRLLREEMARLRKG